ncbi:MAG TPA: FecR family protein [Dongiaceae bacterium]|nr:FecR family protein [Dongiaceae bacterium]
MKRHLAYQVCYVIAAVAAFGGSATAAGIATVTEVVNEGYRTPPGHEEQTAKRADELVQDEALRTDGESSILVKFIDGSELSVEAESQVVLSEYVFDGSASKGLINLNDGLFHFTSNGKDDQGVRLKTPVATIGVRGTEFLVHVDGDDATVIDILSGAVAARPHGTGKEITCYEGQSILIASADDDGLCGDIGSFSTAAGPGGNGGNSDRGNHDGADKPRHERPKPEPKKDPPPKPDPEPEPEPCDCSNNVSD